MPLNATAKSATASTARSGAQVLRNAKPMGFIALLRKLTFARAFTLVHRLVIFATAILYATASFEAAGDIISIMSAIYVPETSTSAQTSALIAQYIGTESVRNSPLVVQVLGNVTTLREGMLYLETNGTSWDGCHTQGYLSDLYDNAILRSLLEQLVDDTAYYFSGLAQMDVIAPVVDCTFPTIAQGLREMIRFYILLRSTSDHDDVYVASVRVSIQDYAIQGQKEKGPSVLVDLTLLNDMRTSKVAHHFAGALRYPYKVPMFVPYDFRGMTTDGYWVFQTSPQNSTITAVKTIRTVRRTGFYVSAENIKSNIKHVSWEVESNATQALTQWTLKRTHISRNSWAWTHFVHFYFAFDAMFNLAVLGLVVRNNFHKGKLWIGDAFVFIANTLFLRGVCILISWCIENFWTLFEYSIYLGNELYGIQHVPIYSNIMRADLLTLYLCALTVVGHVLKEKIDPALSLFAFEIAWSNRVGLTRWFSQITQDLSELAASEYDLGYVSMTNLTKSLTPFRFWTIHSPGSNAKSQLFQSIVPIMMTMFFHVAYALVRKLYHHFRPDPFNTRNTTNRSQNEHAMTAQKRTLTLFEIATGAALQNRVGVIADYENCWFIKGMKYASADGIFSSGFVIANGKFLIAMVDLPVILLMKLTRLRFRNIHIFEVNGSTVNQTAQLVYPDTMSWMDLLNLNLSILS